MERRLGKFTSTFTQMQANAEDWRWTKKDMTPANFSRLLSKEYKETGSDFLRYHFICSTFFTISLLLYIYLIEFNIHLVG